MRTNCSGDFRPTASSGCLEDEITRELIDAAAEAEPMRFIRLDKGFQGNDHFKANAVQTFAARNQGRDKVQQIVFHAV
ncbi:MAG: hypothetical protein V1816_25125 [Pseudomonadota bacterium]